MESLKKQTRGVVGSHNDMCKMEHEVAGHMASNDWPLESYDDAS